MNVPPSEHCQNQAAPPEPFTGVNVTSLGKEKKVGEVNPCPEANKLLSRTKMVLEAQEAPRQIVIPPKVPRTNITPANTFNRVSWLPRALNKSTQGFFATIGGLAIVNRTPATIANELEILLSTLTNVRVPSFRAGFFR